MKRRRELNDLVRFEGALRGQLTKEQMLRRMGKRKKVKHCALDSSDPSEAGVEVHCRTRSCLEIVETKASPSVLMKMTLLHSS